jgi:signal transduction histidine kinase
MLDRRPDIGMTFGDQLDLLASEIRQLPDVTPQGVIEHACTRLADIKPLSDAGVFRWTSANRSLEWMYLSHPDTEFMNNSLHTYHSGLAEILRDGISSQFETSDNNQTDSGTFIGIPIGIFDGAPAGLGLSSTRSLEHEEMHRLIPFGLILGLIAENAQLKRIVDQDQDAGSTARLIGFIAHELRTPLTGMRGNIQLALMATRKEQYDRIPKRLETAISSVDEMSGMVQQLLDVSRLERDSFPFDPASADISQTISSAIESAATDDRLASRRIRADAIDEVVIEHDRAAFQQMMCYLFLTANQYSDDSADIIVSTELENDALLIRLTYEGEPFSNIDQTTLVEPLVNAEAARDQHENMSLDLAFCRGIVTHLVGHIAFESNDPSSRDHSVSITLPAQS